MKLQLKGTTIQTGLVSMVTSPGERTDRICNLTIVWSLHGLCERSSPESYGVGGVG